MRDTIRSLSFLPFRKRQSLRDLLTFGKISSGNIDNIEFIAISVQK